MSAKSPTNTASISEFMHLSGLTPEVLIAMLDEGRLPLEFGAHGELLIDLIKVSPKIIATTATHSTGGPAKQDDSAFVEEIVASEVLKGLDSMVGEALALIDLWRK